MVKLFALQTSVFIIKIIHEDTHFQYQAAKRTVLYCIAKNSWTQMRPEARPIEFTNGPFLCQTVDKGQYGTLGED